MCLFRSKEKEGSSADVQPVATFRCTLELLFGECLRNQGIDVGGNGCMPFQLRVEVEMGSWRERRGS